LAAVYRASARAGRADDRVVFNTDHTLLTRTWHLAATGFFQKVWPLWCLMTRMRFLIPKPQTVPREFAKYAIGSNENRQH
jgi:hypothetical protein